MAGTAIGGSIAAASVTIFGSSTLGSMALALGLISSPVWPVIAGGITGAATAHILWKICKEWGNNPIMTGA
jgi:predicted anti-sigma-YlaC factor YlaD